MTTTSERGDSLAHWVALQRRLSFTFAGLFIGAVTLRCLALERQRDQAFHPLTPLLLDLLPRGCSALYLPAQTISQRLPRISRLGRGICYIPQQGTRSFIDLSGSFESYLKKFSNKTRSTMRRKIRRFTREYGGLGEWREFRAAEEMENFFSLAAEVCRKTYQHRLLRAGILSLSSAEETVHGASAGRVRGYILFCRKRPIAYMLCWGAGDDLVVEQMGFDPQFAAVSPGFVLFWFALERLFAAGEFGRLDLGEGEYPYKMHLATSGVQVAEVYCFPWNFRNAVLVLAHSAVAEAARLLRTALDTLGVAQRLRKLLHHGAQRVSPPSDGPW